MDFLRREDEQEEWICLAVSSFDISGEEEVLKDMGSQRSYILKAVVGQTGYTSIGEERIQHTLFGGKQSGTKYEPVKSLNLFVDAKDFLHMKTRISEWKAVSDFRYTALLPPDHPVITRLIHETHVKANHEHGKPHNVRTEPSASNQVGLSCRRAQAEGGLLYK
uniref:Uncharacterized protein n=1 Tax=Timema poppense TaxID=170557 RepID=A0A7R9D3I3_TIMPO|nr:unnamed protein product [Timema poppensis]